MNRASAQTSLTLCMADSEEFRGYVLGVLSGWKSILVDDCMHYASKLMNETRQ